MSSARYSANQASSVLSPRSTTFRAKQQMRDQNNSVDLPQQNDLKSRSIFSGPQDKLSKVRIGANLLFGGKTKESSVLHS